MEECLKVTLLHGCFSRFLNCAHGTKSRKVLQLGHLLYFSTGLIHHKYSGIDI